MFHKPISEVTRDERRKAKTANFGIIYGISAFGLAERMEVSRTEARQLIDSYFQTYPGVRRYMDESIERARNLGTLKPCWPPPLPARHSLTQRRGARLRRAQRHQRPHSGLGG